MMAPIMVQSCQKCRGALYAFKDEFSCINCGTVIYPNPPDYSLVGYTENGRKRRQSKELSHEWWEMANHHVIALIKQGMTPTQIKRKTGVDMRLIREIREQLKQAVHDDNV